jgi:hypothetical protein
VQRLRKFGALAGESVYLTGIIVFILTCVLYLRDMLAEHKLLLSFSKGTVNMTDFSHFYMAGQLVSDPATRSRVYDVATQMQWQRNFTHVPDLQTVFYYQLPPPSFLMVAPLAALPIEAAYVACMLLSLLLVACAFWATRQVAHKNAWQAATIFLCMLAAVPGYICVFHGQFAFILLALLTVFYFGLNKHRDWLAGISLGLLVFKPHYQLFFGVILLMQRRWRACIIAIGTACLCYIVTAWVIGVHNIIDYPHVLWQAETDTRVVAGEVAEGEECIRGLLSEYLPRTTALLVSGGCALAAMVGCGWLFKQARNETERALAFASAIIACLLFSPHTHLYDWLLGTLAAWYAFGAATELNRGSNLPEVRSWYWACVVYPFASWLVFFFGKPRSDWFDLLHLSYLILALLAFRAVRCRAIGAAT